MVASRSDRSRYSHSVTGNKIPAGWVDATGLAFLELLGSLNDYVNTAPGRQPGAVFVASATPDQDTSEPY